MSSRVVFYNGMSITVAQDKADVVHAIRRDHPDAVTIQIATRPASAEWDRTGHFEEPPARAG